MGKVACFAVDGLELWFNSSDHLSHQIHVRRPGKWEIRVYFLVMTEETVEYDVKWGSTPGRRVLDTLKALVIEHREELLLEWEAKVCLG